MSDCSDKRASTGGVAGLPERDVALPASPRSVDSAPMWKKSPARPPGRAAARKPLSTSLFEVPTVPKHPLWRGSDARLYEAALDLRRRVDWLPPTFPDPDTEAFYFWLVNFGLRMDPELLSAFLPPIPVAERLQ